MTLYKLIYYHQLFISVGGVTFGIKTRLFRVRHSLKFFHSFLFLIYVNMTRLFPICLLFLIEVIALMEADEDDCDGCFLEGKCHKYDEDWLEKMDIICALKTCHRMSRVEWKIYAKSVYCRKPDGNCVGKGKKWTSLDEGECWTHECRIFGMKRIRILSISGGNCNETTTTIPTKNRKQKKTRLPITEETEDNGSTGPIFYRSMKR
ncbi:uncharacterized protein LOC106872057 isoform X2 [Octopus bimaculoides]|uniref:Uncharacterized protein n=1 Tax=Octopus bimaculoides TaxID=37653 RepID=A0A0L8IDL1_OCTBM|nr:uncharacterized protein LOC106872057 isoform X2 [Octopus bimaculoides]